MEVDLSSTMKKAILITGGTVKVPRDFRPPFRLSRSTAGPGAGFSSIVLAFDGLRVKKAISREEGEFELVVNGNGFSMLWKGERFIENVEIRPVLYHSPEQAFFNLGQKCIFDCLFCTSRRLGRDATKDLSPEKVVEMILAASTRDDFKAVALTSAVVGSIQETLDRMLYVIREVRKALPDIPIGVEPYVQRYADIDAFKDAGADEIKINIESYDAGIVAKVCPKLELERQIGFIEHAVKVFGIGNVHTNIIIGLGESDENVLAGVERMASIGCIPSIRTVKVNEFNRKDMETALGEIVPVTAERLMRLSIQTKDILARYGLTTTTCRTMCHECNCCDIVPFRDI